ncbi:MAG: PD-(D/E)XK nuclease family protein [Bacteroidales bacterium]|nr:PD-(D/E)XK nuclease family protein [Bacteroidales bacterium]
MEEKDFEQLLKFSKKFKKKKIEEEKKLPYHINVIDELHINENGHSRVLTKLLQYRNKNKYVLLQSLLKYITEKKKKTEFRRIKIDAPTITQEKKRIDLWVRDTEYAIIFENKVYDATDQKAQIYRYIKKTKDARRYKDEQIYVIYLSRDGKEPDPQSWGKYKESFVSRYVNLSFRNDILPWLRECILSKFNNNNKEKYLQSAILQYIDFLEGEQMFRTNQIYTDMNKKLDELIRKEFNLNDCENEKERYDILNSNIKNLNDVINQMDIMMESYYPSLQKWYTKKWRATVKPKRFSKVNFYNLKDENNFCFGFCISKDCSVGEILLWIGYDDQKLFCQAQFKDQRKIKHTQIMKLKHILTQNNANSIFKFFEKEEFDDVFDCFQNALEELEKLN